MTRQPRSSRRPRGAAQDHGWLTIATDVFQLRRAPRRGARRPRRRRTTSPAVSTLPATTSTDDQLVRRQAASGLRRSPAGGPRIVTSTAPLIDVAVEAGYSFGAKAFTGAFRQGVSVPPLSRRSPATCSSRRPVSVHFPPTGGLRLPSTTRSAAWNSSRRWSSTTSGSPARWCASPSGSPTSSSISRSSSTSTTTGRRSARCSRGWSARWACGTRPWRPATTTGRSRSTSRCRRCRAARGRGRDVPAPRPRRRRHEPARRHVRRRPASPRCSTYGGMIAYVLNVRRRSADAAGAGARSRRCRRSGLGGPDALGRRARLRIGMLVRRLPTA